MAKFSTDAPSGLNLYATLKSPTSPTMMWDTTALAFEVADSASWTDYDFPMPEVDSAGVYVSTADFPSTITTPGAYPYLVRIRVGGSPDADDPIYAAGIVDWDGSSEVVPSTYVTTRAFVKVQNQITVSTYDTLIDQMLPGVTVGIATYLRRPVVAQDFDEIRSGPGADYIRLYQLPVNSIDAITFNLDDVGETEVAGTNFSFDPDTGIVRFKPTSTTQYAFSSAFRSIKVEYNGGWVSVPQDVQIAAALIIRKLIEFGDAERLVTEKVEGNRKQKYDTLTAQATGGSFRDPVFADAVGLLNPYRVVRY